tara:strand:- start:17 stop:574 length:558 start_codon:yes stop_codon:yes gene_type:complete
MSQIKIISKSNYTDSQAWKNYQPPTQIKIDDIIAIGEDPDSVISQTVGSILDGNGEAVSVTVSTSAIVFFNNFTYANLGSSGTAGSFMNPGKYILSTAESFDIAASISMQQLEDGVPVTAMPSTLEEINAKYNIRQAIVNTICGNNGSSVSLVPVVVDYVTQDDRFTAEAQGGEPRPVAIPPVEW